jgi:hypothetical protein
MQVVSISLTFIMVYLRNHLMRYILIFLLLIISVVAFAATGLYNNGYLSVNNINFNFVPQVNYKTPSLVLQSLVLTQVVTDSDDSCNIDFTSSVLDLKIKLVKSSEYYSKAWLTQVTVNYKQDVLIQDILLNLVFESPQGIQIFKGTKAIESRSITDNIDLCPYTDKVIELAETNSSFWIVGSNHAGCDNIEWIKSSSISLYDHTLHFARLYRPPTPSEQMIDYMPKKSGQTDIWSFLLFEQKPFALSINRWPGEKKAAFALSNDADVELLGRLMAAYFGSDDPANPCYLTKGLIANNIKVSNTVFSNRKPLLNEVWTSIMNHGNSIGTHTHSDTSDVTSLTEQSLLNDLEEYNVRLWIDHSLPNNKEDFGMFGGFENSPYYIQDVVNRSKVDYVWLGDTPATNPFNSFDEPWRLPHRVYYFQNLTRPIWFFGRSRMETWEFLDAMHIYDMKYNLTPTNLDNLIQNNGLCVGYTHFCFNHNDTRWGFYKYFSSGYYEIRDDFNDVLIMLNDYQTNKGLWIDTVESIFDRMLAIERVKVIRVEDDWVPGFLRITLQNTSDFSIPDFSFKYKTNQFTIPLFEANSQYSFIINKSLSGSSVIPTPFQVYYKEGFIAVKSSNSESIPSIKAKIYNIKGQLITSKESLGAQSYLLIPFANKASGIYIAKIESEEFKPQVLRFNIFK